MSGALAANVLRFGRVLRRAGLPVGSDRIALALQALPLAGLESRADFQATLAACFVDRAEHRELFDLAFDLFWRDAAAGLPLAAAAEDLQATDHARLAAALAAEASGGPPSQTEAGPGLPGGTAEETLRRRDFDSMTPEEWAAARRLLPRLAPLFELLPTRRPEPAPHPGRPDGRATLRALARQGGELWQMRWQRPRVRPAPLVVLADISGSMSRYSRMLLHFAHALGHADARVESFVFGTRLTRTTRALRLRDPDTAIAQVVREVQDWSGGTRISESLHAFNQHWARRVLPGRATVLLVTDGLEHGDTTRLAFEMERLHKSCRRLVWLNPLLRFARFEPRAAGIRTMLPHVDCFLPAHNLESLAQIASVLSQESAMIR